MSSNASLTARERQILALIAEGSTNRQVAARLGIAETTVENHLRSIYRKLGVTNRMSAVMRALQLECNCPCPIVKPRSRVLGSSYDEDPS